jgi:SAM-dependent methyltransferase
VRGRVFGEVAEGYDTHRPGYPEEMVDEVLAYADLGDRPAVEVGAGTGKATAAFAARGVPLLCLEPDPRMAEVLRRNTAAFPGVRVHVGGFEEWRPDGGGGHGLLLAATSWHWLDRDRRWDLAHAALAPGGAVALCWNRYGLADAALHAGLAEVDDRYGVDHAPHGARASLYDGEPGGPGEEAGWPEGECRRDGRFADPRSVRIRWRRRYGTDRYLGFLDSISAYRVLPRDRRERALSDTARVLEAHGGGVDLLHVTDLFLARAR